MENGSQRQFEYELKSEEIEELQNKIKELYELEKQLLCSRDFMELLRFKEEKSSENSRLLLEISDNKKCISDLKLKRKKLDSNIDAYKKFGIGFKIIYYYRNAFQTEKRLELDNDIDDYEKKNDVLLNEIKDNRSLMERRQFSFMDKYLPDDVTFSGFIKTIGTFGKEEEMSLKKVKVLKIELENKLDKSLAGDDTVIIPFVLKKVAI